MTKFLGNITSESLPARTEKLASSSNRRGSYPPPGAEFHSEADGLTQLKEWLTKKSKTNRLAGSIAEDLTFIGQPEFESGIAQIANQWNKWLNQSDDHQIFLPADYYRPKFTADRVKSQTFILEKILQSLNQKYLPKIKLIQSANIIGDKADRLTGGIAKSRLSMIGLSPENRFKRRFVTFSDSIKN
ncbi:MAG: hypothetical protein LBM73_00865 [Candidatus Nomurabacteria bacterium]|jgi:hypothetical protein|nr:hypothetical protein [Candidatus Nomurabacteria bacterium]